VNGGSYTNELPKTGEVSKFPYPLEVIRGYYQAKHKEGGHQMTVFVSSRGHWGVLLYSTSSLCIHICAFPYPLGVNEGSYPASR